MDYLNSAMLLYLTRQLDWDTYILRRKGPDADIGAEREALLEVVRTCASICADLEPAARAGWELEARLEAGDVKLPPHMAQGYEKLREAGLVSFTIAEEYGGFALPKLVMNMAIQLISRADASLMTVLGLQAGVANDIELYASDALKREYLPRFASGELWGAMDLTEPHAGSDLGAITTRAYEVNGQSLIEGQKIFITNGGAQVHLVLARDDASFDKSRGTTEGLSLFLVPRTLPDGKPNAITVERLESKLGLHGSPTCSIRLDRAVGYRIAEQGRGFKAMLQLMNHARLGVAAQGIGISEAALHESLAYAAQRVQFGKPIGEQPLMKSMLARMVMATEGSRALLYRTCWLIDRNEATAAYLAREGDAISAAERSALEAQMERDTACVRLLTPLAKYLATESCDQVTRMAIQIHGGLGFMKESTVGRPAPRRHHHHDLRGHLRDPGLLRAQGDRARRARHPVPGAARRARQAHQRAAALARRERRGGHRARHGGVGGALARHQLRTAVCASDGRDGDHPGRGHRAPGPGGVRSRANAAGAGLDPAAPARARDARCTHIRGRQRAARALREDHRAGVAPRRSRT